MTTSNDLLVSVITPSYNKGMFIEETINSVKNQTYSNIEHIVIDGKSTDITLEVLRKYGNNIKWVSEPDKGQSDAINKGWKMARGEIYAYLNADDTYLPDTIERVVKIFNENPGISTVYGDCLFIDDQGKEIDKYIAGPFDINRLLYCDDNIPQPSAFFRRDVLDKIGYLDTDLHLGMDLDYFIRIGLTLKVKYVNEILATSRLYGDTKTELQFCDYLNDWLHILDKVYSRSDLSGEIESIKNKAYSSAYLYTGIRYLSRLQIKNARSNLIKGIELYPRHILNAYIAISLALSICGLHVTKMIINLKRKVMANKNPRF